MSTEKTIWMVSPVLTQAEDVALCLVPLTRTTIAKIRGWAGHLENAPDALAKLSIYDYSPKWVASFDPHEEPAFALANAIEQLSPGKACELIEDGSLFYLDKLDESFLSQAEEGEFDGGLGVRTEEDFLVVGQAGVRWEASVKWTDIPCETHHLSEKDLIKIDEYLATCEKLGL